MNSLIQNWSPSAFVVSAIAFAKVVGFVNPIAVVTADIFKEVKR